MKENDARVISTYKTELRTYALHWTNIRKWDLIGFLTNEIANVQNYWNKHKHNPVL